MSVKSSTCYEEIVNLSFVKKNGILVKKKKNILIFVCYLRNTCIRREIKAFGFQLYVYYTRSFFFFSRSRGGSAASAAVLWQGNRFNPQWQVHSYQNFPMCVCVCRFSHKVPQLSLGEIVSGLRCRVVSRHQQKRRATHFYTTQTGLLGENNRGSTPCAALNPQKENDAQADDITFLIYDRCLKGPGYNFYRRRDHECTTSS